MNHRSNVERYEMTSKPKRVVVFGISSTETCLLVGRCPAERWREPNSGFYAELREPVQQCQGKSASSENCEAENRSVVQGRTNL